MTTAIRPVIDIGPTDFEEQINPYLDVHWSTPHNPLPMDLEGELVTRSIELHFIGEAREDINIPWEIAGTLVDPDDRNQSVRWEARRGEVIPANCGPNTVAVGYRVDRA